MSWGYRVTILTLGFVSFMTFLVIGAFRQNFDLVTEDYYGKELQFQSQIEKQKNQQALKENISYTFTDQSIRVKFPSDFEGKKIEGTALFYRPSDATKDVNVNIGAVKEGILEVNKSQFVLGFYKIQIDYKVDGVEYYFEDALMIQ